MKGASMVKPNFLIVGAMKCATTTFANLLNQHPDVFCAPEQHYFSVDRKFRKGRDWYESHFKKAKAVGEKTPAYMFLRKCAKRIFDYDKEMKLIFIIRNPVDMVYSYYWHSYKDGAEKRSFTEVIRREEDGTESDFMYRYAQRGKYSIQIKRYLKLFDKKQMHFIILEEFNKQPQKVIADLYGFLGVDRTFRPTLTKSNVTKMPRSMKLQRFLWKKKGKVSSILRYINITSGEPGYPKMTNAMRKHLSKKFKLYNKELCMIIGKDVRKFWD